MRVCQFRHFGTHKIQLREAGSAVLLVLQSPCIVSNPAPNLAPLGMMAARFSINPYKFQNDANGSCIPASHS